MPSEVPFDDCLSVDDRIDECCDAFEAAWRNGKRPKIGDFISSLDAVYRDRLFRELLMVDCEWRRSVGESCSASWYRNEFPEFAAEIDATSELQAATTSSREVKQLSDWRPGRRIAHFELLERLGSGAMGDAWKASDTRLKRDVTIKVPHHPSFSRSDGQRFWREGQATGQLKHPRLASVHSIESDGERFFLVAAFVEGKNLRDYTREKKLRHEEIARICAGIGEALQPAHDEGVIHRDLKPANIIIDPHGLPHVIDFGLAKSLGAENELTLHGELIGTPAYMSPELAVGDGSKADARTDVYSLGVILFEMLAGRCPFEGGQASVIGQIVTCEPPSLRAISEAIPRDLAAICLKAMEKVPADRYSSIREMAGDLRRFLDGAPVVARRASPLKHGYRWIRRHWAIASLLLFTLVIVSASAMAIASLKNQNKLIAGFRPVRITTTPTAASRAIVPIDPTTNDPISDPAAIMRPAKTTPLTVELKPGTYLIEAVVPHDGGFDVFEAYRTVPTLNVKSKGDARFKERLGLEPDTCLFSDIVVSRSVDNSDGLVEIVVSEAARKMNPLLAKRIYVDAAQTTVADLRSNPKSSETMKSTEGGEFYITYHQAMRWAEAKQMRIPSAADYDVIIDAAKSGNARWVRTGKPALIEDLFDSYPEWTTTILPTSNVGGNGVARYLRKMHILKGSRKLSGAPLVDTWVDGTLMADAEAPPSIVSVRGVRSATPRFVRP